MQLTITPDQVIPANGSAQVSHNGTGPLTITAKNNNGATLVFTVAAGDPYKWTPPAGWGEVTFTADGCASVYREIATEASAGA